MVMASPQFTSDERDTPSQGVPIAQAPSAGSSPQGSAYVVGTPVMPAAPVQVPVVVPEGLSPGQQMAFSAPDGQLVSVGVPDGVRPGSTILVQYQPIHSAKKSPAPTPAPSAATAPVVAPTPTAPAAPTTPAPPTGPASSTAGTAPTAPPAAASQPAACAAPLTAALPTPTVSVDEDARRAGWHWLIYSLSWLCCCCCAATPFQLFAPVAWIVLAAGYFCKPVNQRALMPQQRRPALASLVTCIVLMGLAVLAGLVAGCVAIGHGIGHHHHHHHHHHYPVHPMTPDWDGEGDWGMRLARVDPDHYELGEGHDADPLTISAVAEAPILGAEHLEGHTVAHAFGGLGMAPVWEPVHSEQVGLPVEDMGIAIPEAAGVAGFSEPIEPAKAGAMPVDVAAQAMGIATPEAVATGGAAQPMAPATAAEAEAEGVMALPAVIEPPKADVVKATPEVIEPPKVINVPDLIA